MSTASSTYHYIYVYYFVTSASYHTCASCSTYAFSCPYCGNTNLTHLGNNWWRCRNCGEVFDP